MKNQFVTYDIAKKLKDLGFDEPCLAVLGTNGIFKYAHNISQFSPMKNSQTSGLLPTAPLWQQVIDWLREEHKIFIEASFWNETKEHLFIVNKYTGSSGGGPTISHINFNTSREKAVLKGLEIITEQNNPA